MNRLKASFMLLLFYWCGSTTDAHATVIDSNDLTFENKSAPGASYIGFVLTGNLEWEAKCCSIYWTDCLFISHGSFFYRIPL